MSKQNAGSSQSHRQPSQSDYFAATTLLRLLAVKSTAEVSELEIRAMFRVENPTLSLDLSCEAVMLAALEQAVLLWRKAVATPAGEQGVSTRAYLDRWLTWAERSELGRFCPIAKLLFAPKTRTSAILRELREIRSEWEDCLLQQLKNDPFVKLGAKQLPKAVKEMMGIYFARQFAMQADEAETYPTGPWLEAMEKSFTPD